MHRLVDPARPRGEGRLEEVGTVGGQQEDDVGVLVESIHLVEQGEQQRRLAPVQAALLGDQVDVLDDDLQQTRLGVGRADEQGAALTVVAEQITAARRHSRV